ncbi:M23 family metallopeptidase [Stenotrophomonas maltophilia]|uniref:M23 family metallopeptidase n=1 Tax=Stenotrophomonas maltophilia TaxID=40324 RepID=UPI000C15FFDE|nr:M23 family metallopeptidase [Stenotrophomonas maltophilia]EKT4070136.1 M23 family metallopeptidase [Stenotrophomonas maltophilia]EKT4079019.1 M23 family metallopeptidase [Stenotrophomonas maltophilia]EKT4098292.1 M23 family metallopeptidase [Stenotrophomonas maltophilia]MBA0232262.1 M23 family metallopeptidase [Stenotrophomonas maltophilia]MBA0291197.1 M23 family metallopeptidase [Stenotrophomonas maltophilia]
MRLSQLIVLGVLLGLGAGWWLRRDAGEPVAASLPEAQPAAAVAPAKGSVAPLGTAPAPAPSAPSAARTADAPSGLLLPVQGVLASQLRDTFTDARSEGRVHDAIDIMATAGTPVLAVADGTVEKLFNSERGGLTIYQFEPSGRWCYYYAHLQRYADGLAEKQVIRRGEVIGYVGSTGNASAEAPHLHFEVHVLGPEKQWWKGESINPYPLLNPPASKPGAASAAK